MSERATALLALWNDIAPELDVEYNDWHANEHVPERLTVPGICWGRRYRWMAGRDAPRYLTLYGLRDPDVLASEPYQRLLRKPTPMSRRMRPELHNVSRWVCRLLEDDTDTAIRLAVWTLVRATDLQAVMDAVKGRLGCTRRTVAQRLTDVAPLPWLSAAQGVGTEGLWLLCAAVDTDAMSAAMVLPSGCLYERQPVR